MELSATDLRLIAGLEAGIELVEKHFRHFIAEDYISTFHAQHVARFRAERKTPISLEQYREDAEAFLLRYIELFKEGNHRIRTQQDVPWPQVKRSIHEKEGIYQLYKEIIIAAEEMEERNAGRPAPLRLV